MHLCRNIGVDNSIVRLVHYALFSVFIAFFMVLLMIAFFSYEICFAVLPALLCVIAVFLLWMRLWIKDGVMPFVDVGVFCALATLIYTVYPVVNFLAGGLDFGLLADFRLLSYKISPLQFGMFHMRHVLYLLSFAACYGMFRKSNRIITGYVEPVRRSYSRVAFIVFVLFSIFFLMLHFAFGVTFNTSYETDTYSQNMAVLGSLPLLALQILTKLWALLFLFKLTVLAIVVNRCKQPVWRIILVGWVFAETVQGFYIRGARTGLVLFVMATLLFYHRFVKPLKLKNILVSGVILFSGFLFLGLVRANSASNLAVAISGVFDDNLWLSANNEFQVIFANAYDVLHLKKSGVSIPWYVYINDVINILPPRQIMPFEKIPASEWYLREIGLSGTGLGLMWGVLAQSIVGFDWLELTLRGAFLGGLLAWVHGWYAKHQYSFIVNIIYVYLCLKVYYTFRDTTLVLLTNVVWEIVPFCIIMSLFGNARSAKSTGHTLPFFEESLFVRDV